MQPYQWIELIVIQLRQIPAGIARAVTCLATCWESCARMVWILSLIVIGFVAANARSRRALIDVVAVAGIAGLARMNADQRKDLIVIERQRAPLFIRCLVASFAICGETCSRMIGALRFLVIFLMTGITIHSFRNKRLLQMASVTTQNPVAAVERSSRHRRVIPLGAGPGSRAVALFALASKTGPVAIILPADPMTVIASRRRAFQYPFQVARVAGYGKMPPR
jgi:hypothetical protein